MRTCKTCQHASSLVKAMISRNICWETGAEIVADTPACDTYLEDRALLVLHEIISSQRGRIRQLEAAQDRPHDQQQ